MLGFVDLDRFVDPKNTAIIVVDIQYDYCSQEGKLAKYHKFNMDSIQEMIPKLGSFVDEARRNKIKVIWTRMTEDSKTAPENLRLKMESFDIAIDLCKKGTKGYDYYLIRPAKSDKEIEKNQFDAFTNPGLDSYLRAEGIKNIIFTGVSTARCVDSTLRSASARGYNCVVPQDLVESPKELANEKKAVLGIWNSIFAYVTKSEDIVKIWSK